MGFLLVSVLLEFQFNLGGKFNADPFPADANARVLERSGEGCYVSGRGSAKLFLPMVMKPYDALTRRGNARQAWE